MGEPLEQATQPDASAWVGANAGSGKTYILVSRLVRLMLEGVAPERLLCLTYTRAAAAEMQERLYDLLAEWALLEDAPLRAAIAERLAMTSSDEQLRRARTLFAQALETPGGLRVQTIHAFCESLLKRFPLEAGLSPQFELLDEQDASDMQAGLITTMLGASVDDDVAHAMMRLTRALNENDLRALARMIIARRATLNGTYEARLTTLAGHLGLRQPVGEAEQYQAAFCDAHKGAAAPLAGWLSDGGKQDKDKAAGLKIFAEQVKVGHVSQAWAAIRTVLLTKEGHVRKQLVSKALAAAQPALAEKLLHLGDEVAQLNARLKAVATYEMSEALYIFAAQMLEAYGDEKRRRAVLDYDDLIAATNHLLASARAAQWVLFKIDNGLEHILVDEAQDTSPAQWQLIGALAAEFFNDETQRDLPRTLFAVGDEKQSIFSFQGADPKEFAAQRAKYNDLVASFGGDFHYVPLIESRRSAPEILHLVDYVFADMAACDGVTADDQPTRHTAYRETAIGHVELWPPVEPPNEAAPLPLWQVPSQTHDEEAARPRLATQIATKIAALLDDESQNVTAGDILILVRKRDDFVEDMTRALKRRAIAVAGADRMVLLDQIAIMDILAALDVALNPLDDMALAIVLRSPVGGLDETQLYDLAHGRKASLWQALRTVATGAKEPAEYKAAFEALSWLVKNGGKLSPHDLLAQFLGARGAHKKLHQRLGVDIDDPISELLRLALAYETRHAASLQGFVHWLRQGQQEIKRDMEGRGAAVRIMTVHGAKGLEAPIVFLPDTCRAPVKRGGAVDRLQFNDKQLPLWRASKELQDSYSAAQIARQEALAAQEERRLLYVALTRARDRLYIGGWLGKLDKEPAAGSWYEMIAKALSAPEKKAQLAGGETALTHDSAPGAIVAEAPSEIPPLPDWVAQKYTDKTTATYFGDKMFSPSGLADDGQTPSPHGMLDAAQRDAMHLAAQRGTLIHKLLESLPDLPPEARHDAAKAYIARQAKLARPVWSPDAQKAMIDEAMRVMALPQLADLFGPQGRAEVPVSGFLDRLQGDRIALSGQIDRLVVRADEVQVADFKTGTPPDETQLGDTHLGAHRGAHRAIVQMAAYQALVQKLYPDKAVICLLVWTQTGRVERLPESQLAHARAALHAGELNLT